MDGSNQIAVLPIDECKSTLQGALWIGGFKGGHLFIQALAFPGYPILDLLWLEAIFVASHVRCHQLQGSEKAVSDPLLRFGVAVMFTL